MKYLNHLRIESGYAIADISRRMAVDEATVCRWLCSRDAPDAAQAERLAALFGVSVHDLDDSDSTSRVSRIQRLRGRIGPAAGRRVYT